jgi:hypothetical protein
MLTRTIQSVEKAKAAYDAQPQPRLELSQLKIVKNPVLHYDNTRTKQFGDYEKPEYDFARIDRLLDVEAYAFQAIKKKSALASKEGFEFVGKIPEHVDYVLRRLEQIAWVTDITTEELLDRILTDLIKYSNSCLAIVRDPKSSGGRSYVDPRTNKTIKPISGFFPIPMSTIEIKFNKRGQAIGYRQKLNNKHSLEKKYTKDKILHFITNQKPGFSVGTPSITPGVIDDILTLRKLEENVEMLTMQNLFPLIHYKVGTEKMPARVSPSGLDEVGSVVSMINNKPPEGIYVTSERHEIKMIGTEGRALRVEAYLDYFKKRVLSGLGLSSVDVGEGDTANRNTADTMSRAVVDEVKAIQKRVERMFQKYVIIPLLYEANGNIDVSDPEQMVYLRFREIDIEAQLKKENHAIQQFMQSTITLTEARAKMGLNELAEGQWDDSYYKLVVEPQELIRAGAAGAESPAAFAAANHPNTPIEPGDVTKAQKEKQNMIKAAEKAKAANKPAGSNNASKGTVANRARPTNQHGTKSAKTRATKDSWKRQFDDEITSLRSDILSINNVNQISHIVGFYKDIATRRITRECRDAYNQGLVSVGILPSDIFEEPFMDEANRLKQRAQKYSSRLFNDIEASIKAKTATIDSVIAKIDAVHYRLAFISRTESARSFNWGAIVGLRQQGEKLYNIDIHLDTDEDEIAAAKRDWHISNATLRNIPPWHPNSTVKVIRHESRG